MSLHMCVLGTVKCLELAITASPFFLHNSAIPHLHKAPYRADPPDTPNVT